MDYIIGFWGGKTRKLYEAQCAHCTNKYFRPAHRKGDRYCSPKCSQAARRRRVEVPCGWCQTPLSVRQSRLSSKSGLHFCNRTCKELAQSTDGLPTFRLPHYKDGVSAYRDRALRILGEKCNQCGYCEDRRMLDVHHQDHNRKNGTIENLRVLCVWCHALETRNVHVHARKAMEK